MQSANGLRSSLVSVVCCSAALALTGCAHAPATAPVAASSSAASASAQQVALGKALYVDHCAKCHGDGGEGGEKAPPVVGSAALPLERPGAKARTGKFHTALDVAVFVKDTMPPKKAGTLSLEQYFAILAFDLQANGVDLGGRTLDAEVAKGIVLHP